VVKILRIPSIRLLESINNQTLFNDIKSFLQKWWIRGVLLCISCQIAPTDHTTLYVWGVTLSEVWFIVFQLSVATLHQSFYTSTMFRVVSPIRRYTSCA